MHNNESVHVTTGGLPAAPLTVWQCDTCGDNITNPGKALVIWQIDDHYRGYDFRIVHMNIDGRCCDPGNDNGFVRFTYLSSFLGANGLAYALAFLRPIEGYFDVEVIDFNGFVDLVQRTQTPWYEEARSYLHTEEWLADADRIYSYMPDVLERIAKQELG